MGFGLSKFIRKVTPKPLRSIARNFVAPVMGSLGFEGSGLFRALADIKKPTSVGTAQAPAGAVGPAQAPAFKPTRPAEMAMPSGLSSELAGFSPEQTRSSLATKGVQVGLGKSEDDYYRNLVQRSLIGDGNVVAPNTDSLLPVESQYFSKKGINTSSIMDFLRQIQGAV